MDDSDPDFNFRHWLQNLFLRSLIGLALLLPYSARVRFFGALMRRVIAPVIGYRARALENLALIWPGMDLAKRQAIAAQVADNVGRTLIENYSNKDFMARMAKIVPAGPGMAALMAARATGQAAILVTGHFGNYEAARAALVAQGFAVGGALSRGAQQLFQ